MKKTIDKFMIDGGKWAKERLRLHNNIIEKMLKDGASSESPVAVLLGGGAASGKSTIRDSILIPELEINVVVVDCDIIKEEIPEYQIYKKVDTAAAASKVHDESKAIANKVLDICIDNRFTFIYDFSLAGKPEEYYPLINRLKEEGYNLEIVGVYVPLDVAKRREERRHKLTGRHVPEDLLIYLHEHFPITFFAIQGEFSLMQFYDNSRDGRPPVLIAEREKENLEIYDVDKYNEIKNRGVSDEKDREERTS